MEPVYTIIHHSNWGEAPKFILCVFVPLWQDSFGLGLFRLGY